MYRNHWPKWDSALRLLRCSDISLIHSLISLCRKLFDDGQTQDQLQKYYSYYVGEEGNNKGDKT